MLYRPGSDQPADPEFAPALELAQRDLELGRWFAAHCALQLALRSKFREISVPEGLKEQIISERKVRLSSRTRKIAVAALASGFILYLLAAATLSLPPFRPKEDNSFANFLSRM